MMFIFTSLFFALLPLTADAAPNENNADQQKAIIKDLPKFSDEPEGIGAGFGVGEPMGIAVAYRPNKGHTLAAMTGWSFSESTLHLHVDYLATISTIRPNQSAISFGIYGGVGPTLNLGRADEQTGFGIRIPVGVSIAFEKPVDVFLEVAPVLGAIPEVKLYANGTVGVRAWFRSKR